MPQQTPRPLDVQARELKTVYVPQATEGLYLRLVLHKCHVNEYNLYNQVRETCVKPDRGGSRVIAVVPAIAEVPGVTAAGWRNSSWLE